MPLVMVDPASKVAYTFTDMKQGELAIAQYGFVPILPSGAQAQVMQFEGGSLVEGAPLNAWIGGAWYEGQKEIVQDLVRKGQAPQPPPEVWGLPVIPVPPDLLATYAAMKGVPQARSLIEAYTTGTPIGGTSNTWLWIAVAGLGLMFLIPRGRQRDSDMSQDGL